MASSNEIEESNSEKQCRLYRLDPVGRIDRELKALTGVSLDSEDQLDAFHINQVDSMHYLGTDGTKSMMNLFPPETNSVLDLGSGFGGCARFVAKTLEGSSDLNVTALELQPNISNAAAKLTKRCFLDSSVSHIAGDILDDEVLSRLPRLGRYDVVFSKLVILHIPFSLRVKLWAALSKAAPGGFLYIEDYFESRELDSEERTALADHVGCPEIPSKDSYIEQLEQAGYTDIVFNDVTDIWRAFVKERSLAFESNQERHLAVHGQSTFENMLTFYKTTSELFDGKGLGGAVITARISS